jgi:hypothetical protein
VNAIRIRHCLLRVVRHGGWSWGADRRRLVEQVTQRLPAWLAQALAEQLADCPPDLTIQQLRLRIPVRMSELRDWPSEYEEQGGDARADDLARRARPLLAAALQDIPRVQPPTSDEPAPVEAQQAAIDEVSLTTVVDTLIAWQRSSELPRMLALADSATLREWARAMVAELAADGSIRGHLASSLASLIESIEVLLINPETRATSLAQELVRIVAACSTPLADAVADPAIREIAPHSPQTSLEVSARSDGPPRRVVPQGNHPSVMRCHVPPARQARRAPVAVESVLPFVVMGVLSRRNYFDGLRAALVCSGLLERSGCFAAALAYKLSPPPNRGWDRGAATRRLASAMCGVDEAPDNATMEGFLRGFSTVCAPLDASLWPSHRAIRRQPGILVEKLEDALWAVLDIASSQPLGWFASPEDALRVADLMPGRLWWLAPGAADSDFPEALARRNLRAVALGVQPRAAGWLSAGAPPSCGA